MASLWPLNKGIQLFLSCQPLGVIGSVDSPCISHHKRLLCLCLGLHSLLSDCVVPVNVSRSHLLMSWIVSCFQNTENRVHPSFQLKKASESRYKHVNTNMTAFYNETGLENVGRAGDVVDLQ